jgi:hypothetical protein
MARCIVRHDNMWYFVINEQGGGIAKSLNDDTENHQEVNTLWHLKLEDFNSSCIGDNGQMVRSDDSKKVCTLRDFETLLLLLPLSPLPL